MPRLSAGHCSRRAVVAETLEGGIVGRLIRGRWQGGITKSLGVSGSPSCTPFESEDVKDGQSLWKYFELR